MSIYWLDFFSSQKCECIRMWHFILLSALMPMKKDWTKAVFLIQNVTQISLLKTTCLPKLKHSLTDQLIVPLFSNTTLEYLLENEKLDARDICAYQWQIYCADTFHELRRKKIAIHISNAYVSINEISTLR